MSARMTDDADQVMESFRRFLDRNWSYAYELFGDAENNELYDWVQANFETMVEAKLCKSQEALRVSTNLFLEPYGNAGAECNSPSSRVWKPDAKPTHAIDVVGTFQKTPTGFYFSRFCSSHNGQDYDDEFPPFDFVILEGNERKISDGTLAYDVMVLPRSSVRFVMRESHQD